MAKDQREIDAKAVRGGKAVGADDQGGQDYITPGRNVKKTDQPKPKMSFRGVRIHDDGPDSWKVGQGLK